MPNDLSNEFEFRPAQPDEIPENPLGKAGAQRLARSALAQREEI